MFELLRFDFTYAVFNGMGKKECSSYNLQMLSNRSFVRTGALKIYTDEYPHINVINASLGQNALSAKTRGSFENKENIKEIENSIFNLTESVLEQELKICNATHAS